MNSADLTKTFLYKKRNFAVGSIFFLLVVISLTFICYNCMYKCYWFFLFIEFLNKIRIRPKVKTYLTKLQ